MLERLTGQDAAPHLANYLLITYKDFSTADELLAALRQQFDGLSGDDPQTRNLRLRIVNILKLWATNHYNDLAEDEAALGGVRDLLAHMKESAALEKPSEAVLAALARRGEEMARRGTVLPAPTPEPDKVRALSCAALTPRRRVRAAPATPCRWCGLGACVHVTCVADRVCVYVGVLVVYVCLSERDRTGVR